MNKKEVIKMLEFMQTKWVTMQIDDNITLTPKDIIGTIKNWIYHYTFVEKYFIPKEYKKIITDLKKEITACKDFIETTDKKLSLQNQYEKAWKIFE